MMIRSDQEVVKAGGRCAANVVWEPS